MKKRFTKILTLLVGSAACVTMGKAQTFNYTGSLQNLTVPACADSATITAYGAQGGGDASPDAFGGMGAEIKGTFKVTPGNILAIMVGQQGMVDIANGAGGGGGSFVWNTSMSDTLMVAAGGGGGGGVDNAASIGGPGSATITPTSGWGTYTAAGGVGGNGGAGGTNGTGSYAGGGGGAGWYSNGITGQVGSSSNPAGTGGQTPLAGGAGGTAAANWGGAGGYGGGGGSGIDGGGGGGYNGGGGSNAYPISGTSGSGGGGGSFNGGTSQSNTAGVQSGNGMVVISFHTLVPKVSPIVGSDSVCEGMSYKFSCGSIPGGTYTWTVPIGSVVNSGQGTDTINVTFGNTSGKIKIAATSGCGNASDSVSVIVTPLPSLTITAKDTSCSSDTVESLVGAPAGGTFSGTGVSGSNFNPSVAGIGGHIVTYTYTNKEGCTNTDSVKLVVEDCLGINEATNSLSNQVKMYPNPFSQVLNINVTSNETISATIFDMLGNNMGTWQLSKGINEINTKSIPSGVYSLQLKTKQGLYNKRLVKVD